MMSLRLINQLDDDISALTHLLIEAVAEGASIGFLAPLSVHDAGVYWQQVAQKVAHHDSILFGAYQQDTLVGTVQLALCHKANGAHRGEVEKLIVAKSAQGQGLAKGLMHLLELDAKKQGLQLLVLDTKVGDTASFLYPKLGYQAAGTIPNFARDGLGKLAATVYFYKELR